MPFYEYECSSCGQQTEALQKVSDAPLKKCPHCGKSTLRRLISAPVFRLKGSGWYETDFKSDQDRKRNLHGEDAPAAKEDDAKPAATTDAKVESKDKPVAAEPTAASKSASKPAAAAAKKPAAPSRSAKAKPVAKKKAGRR
jgi:putative FmdB family regulatory protein